jgi:hypothetical protein
MSLTLLDIIMQLLGEIIAELPIVVHKDFYSIEICRKDKDDPRDIIVQLYSINHMEWDVYFYMGRDIFERHMGNISLNLGDPELSKELKIIRKHIEKHVYKPN